MNRDFKGIWIPREIWLNEDLSAIEKVLLAEIDSLDGEKGCFAGNKYFAEFFGVTSQSISNHIARLKKLGLISQSSFDGRKRTLKSVYKESYKLTIREPESSLEEKSHRITKKDNKKDNKKDSPPDLFDVPQQINPEYVALAAMLYSEHLKVDQRFLAGKTKAQMKTTFDRWAGDIRLLIERDQRPSDEVIDVIRWSQQSDFWQSNILSGKKLRMKFPTLYAQMNRNGGASRKRTSEYYQKNKAEVEAIIGGDE